MDLGRFLRGCFLIVVVLTPLVAGTQEAPVTAEELEVRVRQLESALAELRGAGPTEERLDQLARQIEVLAAELEDLRVGETVVAEASASIHGLGPGASKVYRTERGVSIGGYGEWLGSFYDGEDQSGDPSGKTDTLDDLRAVIYLGYKFSDRWLLNTEIEFEHASTSKSGEASVEFAYLDYLWRESLGIRAGLILVPMGLINEMHEPTTYLGANRPETERRIIPSTWRENGAGIFGSLGALSYRTYVLNGLDAAGFSASGLRGGRQKGSKAKAEDLAWVGRLDWDPAPGLTLGLSAWLGQSGQDMRTDAGQAIGVKTQIWEAHLDWRWRGLEVRGLWAQADLDDVAELNTELGLVGADSIGERLEGGYVQVGWDLLAGRQGQQALIPFIRWENVDTQVRVPDGWMINPANQVKVLTVGMSYKPLEQIVVKMDWQQVDNRASTGVDRFSLGLGYVF